MARRMEPDGPQRREHELKQSTYLNMVACYLKLREHARRVDECSNALASGPSGLPKRTY